jgi:hypothetical protein
MQLVTDRAFRRHEWRTECQHEIEMRWSKSVCARSHRLTDRKPKLPSLGLLFNVIVPHSHQKRKH